MALVPFWRAARVDAVGGQQLDAHGLSYPCHHPRRSRRSAVVEALCERLVTAGGPMLDYAADAIDYGRRAG